MTGRILAIVGPGEGATPLDVENAERMAELAARAGWVVLCGGRNAGVMAAAAKGAARGGGISIGLLPTGDRADAAPELTVALPTGLGEARNALLAQSCDAMAVCGMSPGTASEVGLAAKAGKPIVLIQPDQRTRDFLAPWSSGIRIANRPEEVLALLRTSS